jgi:hypothetical protein
MVFWKEKVRMNGKGCRDRNVMKG